MAAPLVYGLVSVAGKLVVKALKNIPKNSKIISRHQTKDAAKAAVTKLRKGAGKLRKGAGKLQKGAERKLTPKTPQHKIEYSTKGEKGKTPTVPIGRSKEGKEITIPLAAFQKGVQNYIRAAEAAGVGKQRLKTILTAIVGTGTTIGSFSLSQDQNKKLKKQLQEETRRANAPMKREYMKAVNPQSSSESRAAEKNYTDYMSGKARSLKFNYGGMVKKTKNLTLKGKT